MRYVSTRGSAPKTTLSDAIARGIAPDGGLYVPETIPRIAISGPGDTLADTAREILAPFFDGDALDPELTEIVREAFDFAAPLRRLGERGHILELFHGPTAAFKDFGAQFLAACVSRIRQHSDATLTILVATSGDTGAAVAAAFHRRAGIRVVILYPEGRVSPRQAHQLGCFGDNVEAFRVAGSFDDCQRLVKQALGDAELQSRISLSSANSISLGRLLPQMAYYAHASLTLQAVNGRVANFVIPTGNLGNAFAGMLAREMGLPIGRIVLATNANDVLPAWLASGRYEPRASVATIANAMDVGAPSNFERLLWLYPGMAAIGAAVDAISVSDDAIRATIRSHAARTGDVFCPHTATAVHVFDALREREKDGTWVVVATAHPSKFELVVEPLTGSSTNVPPALAELLSRPSSAGLLPNDYETLRRHLLSPTSPDS